LRGQRASASHHASPPTHHTTETHTETNSSGHTTTHTITKSPTDQHISSVTTDKDGNHVKTVDQHYTTNKDGSSTSHTTTTAADGTKTEEHGTVTGKSDGLISSQVDKNGFKTEQYAIKLPNGHKQTTSTQVNSQGVKVSSLVITDGTVGKFSSTQSVRTSYDYADGRSTGDLNAIKQHKPTDPITSQTYTTTQLLTGKTEGHFQTQIDDRAESYYFSDGTVIENTKKKVVGGPQVGISFQREGRDYSPTKDYQILHPDGTSETLNYDKDKNTLKYK